MNKVDIDKLLTIMDNGAKEAFISMSREQQLLVLLSIEMSNSNRIANVEKKQIAMEESNIKYREKREKRESDSEDEIVSTTQKIIKVFTEMEAKKFNWGIYFRDRVLPNILSPAILVLLYLIFTQIKP